MKIYVYNKECIIGFANSIEELKKINNEKSHPYQYDWDKVTSIKLEPDIFSMCWLEGTSNFQDYLKMSTIEEEEPTIDWATLADQQEEAKYMQ